MAQRLFELSYARPYEPLLLAAHAAATHSSGVAV